MPPPAILKRRVVFQFTLIITSIIISILIAVAVPLQKDEIGALVNIYLPVLAGFVTLIVYSSVAFISKKISIRIVTLTLCICLNISIGIILNFSFNSFNNELSSASLKQIEHLYSANKTTSNKNERLEASNVDDFPAVDRAVFSYTYNPDLPLNNAQIRNAITNHDVSVFKVKNKQNKSVIIKEVTFSTMGLWAASIGNGRNFPFTLAPGDSVDLHITFTAKALNTRVQSFWWRAALKFQHWAIGVGRNFNYQLPYGSTCSNIASQLQFKTDDKTAMIKPIQLNGIWEYRYENDWEPGLQRILNSLNFKTMVGFTYFDNGLKGESTTDHSDEIAADYFEVANTRKPVKIRKIASYHGCCTIEDSDTLAIYDPNLQLTRQLQYTNKYSGQMLLPVASNLPDAKRLANLSGPFAVKIGLSFTDRTRNHGKKIGIRVWKAVDEHGKVISNAYILGSDYLGKRGTNYDYQDNVYFIENIKLYSKATPPLMAQK